APGRAGASSGPWDTREGSRGRAAREPHFRRGEAGSGALPARRLGSAARSAASARSRVLLALGIARAFCMLGERFHALGLLDGSEARTPRTTVPARRAAERPTRAGPRFPG